MISSHELKRRKRALRARVRALRDSVPAPDRTERSRAIAERLLALPEVREAGTVLLFSSFGSEVETSEMIERLHASGKRVALPRVEAGDVVVIAYRPGDAVREAAFGALEPVAGAAVPPEELDVVVAPGLAFDRRGYRVGYGRGFYDRLLRRLRPDGSAIAVAFGLQVVDEVPHSGGDVPVDAIVTEEGTIRCR